MSRGNGGETLFLRDDDLRAFLGLVTELPERFGAGVPLPESVQWDQAHQVDIVLMPVTGRETLARLTRDILTASGRLTGQVHAPEVLRRFAQFYGSREIVETDRLIAIAAGHHRLAWIHPFGDGNGRVIRLHSQALMIHHGLDGGGLWTLSRGLARHRQRYYDHLQAADLGRRNDLDGRGNLSDAGLAAFCRFFLETVLDQIQFMSSLLGLPALRIRVERYFQFETLHLKLYREELMRVVRTLIDEGEIPRARVQEITGKGATVSAEIIKLGLQEGLVESPSPKGPLQPGFPPKILEFYFPQLFVDLPADESARRGR
jgi:hypothetical protein